MSLKNCFVFSLLIFVILSCTQKKIAKQNFDENKQPYIINANEAIFGWTGGDTTVSFLFLGKQKLVLVKKRKDLTSAVKNFQAFLNEFENKKLEWNHEINADLNGDGESEKVISSIWLENDTCYVLKEVYNKQDELFWSYSHSFDDMDDLWFFGTRDAYENLKPFSTFYLGYLSREFDTISLNDFYKEAFAKKLERIAEFKNPHDYADLEEIENYLNSFKGKCLQSYWLTYDEKLIYIFYKPENQFIAIKPKDYLPQKY